MKKLFLGLTALAFFFLSSFTNVDSKKTVLHQCTYRVYGNGQYLGNITINMWDFADCDSLYAHNVAIWAWNRQH
jgi:hypothetical protein